MVKLSLRMILMAMSLLMITACSKQERPTLSVSIEPQRKMLEQLVGDKYDVITIMANGANPETYDPSMAQRMAVDKSAIYFTTGFLPFEQQIEATSNGKVRIVDTSTGIEHISGTHSHGDEVHEQDVDPHLWTSVRNGMTIAQNMMNALIEIDPDNAEYYRSRYVDQKAHLDSIDALISDRISQSDAHAFMVWHPSLSYYARDYGLHQIAVGQESKEMSLSNLRDVIDEAREDSVRVFFFQREYDSRQAESLNKEIGSRLVTIDPLAYDWENELIKITDELTK